MPVTAEPTIEQYGPVQGDTQADTTALHEELDVRSQYNEFLWWRWSGQWNR
jgi:hypothetical protein